MVTKVNAAHILVSNQRDAATLKDRILNGEKFAEVARRYSQCPSKSNGGQLGWFGRGQMVKEFENAAFSARRGDLIGPVKTNFGWHIILVLDQQ